LNKIAVSAGSNAPALYIAKRSRPDRKRRDAAIHPENTGIADYADSSSPSEPVESRRLVSGGCVSAIAQALRIFTHGTAEDWRTDGLAETKFTVLRLQHGRDEEPYLIVCSESGV